MQLTRTAEFTLDLHSLEQLRMQIKFLSPKFIDFGLQSTCSSNERSLRMWAGNGARCLRAICRRVLIRSLRFKGHLVSIRIAALANEPITCSVDGEKVLRLFRIRFKFLAQAY